VDEAIFRRLQRLSAASTSLAMDDKSMPTAGIVTVA